MPKSTGLLHYFPWPAACCIIFHGPAALFTTKQAPAAGSERSVAASQRRKVARRRATQLTFYGRDDTIWRMEKAVNLLLGNEAIALGAIRAGVQVAAGYPGTPSSEVMETIAREAPPGVYVEWSVNEKAAMELAAGAAIVGARAIVTMKQVGLNVASDPLMSLNYLGVTAGLVVVVADDPGPISSQTEQDSRHFGQFAKIAVFDPSSPEEAYLMVADAFDYSERIGRPVLFRPTTRVCHGYATVEVESAAKPPPAAAKSFDKAGGRWVIFPKLTYASHIKIEKSLAELGEAFCDYRGNYYRAAQGTRLGVAAGGVSWLYAQEALAALECDAVGAASSCGLLKVGTVPVPERLAVEFLRGVDEALVIEELDPVIERALVYLCGRHGIPARVRGKLTGDMPVAGEYAPASVREALRGFLGGAQKKAATSQQAATQQQAATKQQAGAPPLSPPPPLPARPPVLCAGCPHRASFFAVKEATARAAAAAAPGRRSKPVWCGDIGCYTLANAMPLDMVDTCLCMGADITQAQGISRADPDALCFAFIGDSTFFHSGLTGLANAAYNGADVIVCVLDNGTTAMTGGQQNPGTGKRLAIGRPPARAARKLDIVAVASALGADDVQRVDAFDLAAAKAAVRRAVEMDGVRVLVFEGECIALARKGEPCEASNEACVGCGACVRKLGCPALTMRDNKAAIDASLCTGCGLCAQTCAFGAIGGGKADARRGGGGA